MALLRPPSNLYEIIQRGRLSHLPAPRDFRPPVY